FVSFVMPHFPLIAPEPYYRQYEGYDLAALRTGLDVPPASHPTLDRMRSYFDYDAHFDDQKRAVALRAYFGMVSRLDELIGTLVSTVAETGFGSSTRIIYSSDHGDCLGNRGLWGKSVMYDDAARVPMVLAGAGVPEGWTVETPVSLVDIAPTMHHLFGVPTDGMGLRGRSLIELANGANTDRVAFSEYHAAGSDTGQFMIRKERWKYVRYVGAPPQLFDIGTDPQERNDLGQSPGHAAIRQELDGVLSDICSPEEVNAQAFADQSALIAAHGGPTGIEQSADIPFTPAPV
ncbi:MAG: sulfatase-like hydrolase/transferase, partial [Pseudomonadota bacterium]